MKLLSTSSSMAGILLAIAPSQFSIPAYSLTQDLVSEKLSTVIVYAPVSKDQPRDPLLLTFNHQGKSKSVYFAAFSSAAIPVILSDRLGPQNAALAKTLKFAPFSLSKFSELVAPKLKKDSSYLVQYVPDPGQAKSTEDLLSSQGLAIDKARSIAETTPVIFCPSPTFSITPNSGSLQGQTFVPCSTSLSLLQSLVSKANSSSNLKKTASVLAIPLPSFVSLLQKGSPKDVGSIRVLPSPDDVKVIEDLRGKSGSTK